MRRVKWEWADEREGEESDEREGWQGDGERG